MFKVVVGLMLAMAVNAHAESMRAGLYFIPEFNVDLSVCKNNQSRDFLNEKEEPLASACSKEYLNCLNEGSCVLNLNGERQLLNVTSVNAETMEGRWKIINPERCPFGVGVKNICLDPNYSVAADSEVFKAGDVIFVSSLAGQPMPNGDFHDGYFIVRDFNRYLKGTDGEHFLFFAGGKIAGEKTLLELLGLDNARQKLEYVKVTGEKAAEIRTLRNFPVIPGTSVKVRLYK